MFNKFILWYNKIKNTFNTTIKFLGTVNGTEFTNNYFVDFCNNIGICHEFTIPYPLQQNGWIERLHGTLIPNARVILEEAKLNHVFWEDAIDTINYIHNRIPHNDINNSIPYELLYDKKIDFSNFRVFVCNVFFYVQKQFHKKLLNSALPGIFLGYDSNPSAYRIYDVNNNKIILSRSIVFFENISGNCASPKSPPEFIILLLIMKSREKIYLLTKMVIMISKILITLIMCKDVKMWLSQSHFKLKIFLV